MQLQVLQKVYHKFRLHSDYSHVKLFYYVTLAYTKVNLGLVVLLSSFTLCCIVGFN